MSQRGKGLTIPPLNKDKSRTVPFRPPGAVSSIMSACPSIVETHSEKLRNHFPANVVRNQKYNVFTFLPLVFYEQFKFFFNLYFLLVALSQFFPPLKTGKNDRDASRRINSNPFLFQDS